MQLCDEVIPADIRITGKVVHAAARLWHRRTIHVILFTGGYRWRVACTGAFADTGDYDVAPYKEPDCLQCDRSVNWDGGIRNRNGYWIY